MHSRFSVFPFLALLCGLFCLLPGAPRDARAGELSDALDGTFALGGIVSEARIQGAWDGLIARLEADGFERAKLEDLFARLDKAPDPLFMAEKVVELASLQRISGAALNAPPENAASFAPPDYQRIAGGVSAAAGRAFIDRNAKLFAGAYKHYGVPAPFIVAVLMVETGLGAELGRHPALHALASMAATDSLEQVLPCVRGISGQEPALKKMVPEKAAWAYEELKALIRHGHNLGPDLTKIPGSVYGAVGLSQFMPSNIPVYGVDADGDGRIDLFKLPDAVYSIASYLAAHGWKKAQTPSAQIQVLRSYNHSDIYASTVYGVAMQIISPTTFASAQAAQKGGSAVRAARAGAQSALPRNSKSKEAPVTLPSYDALLK